MVVRDQQATAQKSRSRRDTLATKVELYVDNATSNFVDEIGDAHFDAQRGAKGLRAFAQSRVSVGFGILANYGHPADIWS